jgi:hypothetical protein
MDRLNKMALRKIKESGNYNTFLRLKRIKKGLFEHQSIYKIYIAIRKPKDFYLYNEELLFEEFLEKNHLKFSF